MTRNAATRFLMCSVSLGSLLVLPVNAADLAASLPPPVVTVTPTYDLNVTYAGEVWHNIGGLKTGTDYMYALDAGLNINLERLIGLQNAKFYVEGFYAGGKSLELNYTGAAQAPSAVDAFFSMNTLKLYQAYYEQTFGSTDILAGKYDVQTQFGTTRPMDLFANKAQAMNFAFFSAGVASGLNGPSVYPNTAVGIRIKQTLNDQWSFKVGVLDGEADLPNGKTGILFEDKYGALGVGEIDYTPWANTKLMAGVWGLTGHLNKLGLYDATFSPVKTWGDMGEYVGGTTRLYTIAGNRGIDTFFNVGLSSGATNLTNHSYDAGLTFTGLLDVRPSDKLGVAFATEETTDAFKRLLALTGAHLASYETDIEVTYRAKITDWLVLQPEFDYIVHPASGGQANGAPLKNAVVFGLHFELHKEFSSN
jgi:porin